MKKVFLLLKIALISIILCSCISKAEPTQIVLKSSYNFSSENLSFNGLGNQIQKNLYPCKENCFFTTQTEYTKDSGFQAVTNISFLYLNPDTKEEITFDSSSFEEWTHNDYVCMAKSNGEYLVVQTYPSGKLYISKIGETDFKLISKGDLTMLYGFDLVTDFVVQYTDKGISIIKISDLTKKSITLSNTFSNPNFLPNSNVGKNNFPYIEKIDNDFYLKSIDLSTEKVDKWKIKLEDTDNNYYLDKVLFVSENKKYAVITCEPDNAMINDITFVFNKSTQKLKKLDGVNAYNCVPINNNEFIYIQLYDDNKKGMYLFNAKNNNIKKIDSDISYWFLETYDKNSIVFSTPQLEFGVFEIE